MSLEIGDYNVWFEPMYKREEDYEQFNINHTHVIHRCNVDSTLLKAFSGSIHHWCGSLKDKREVWRKMKVE